ncbi:hypothetical protein HN747_03660 [archaeon]|jgi:hypothetical protein|nr:hypothetical protein [archaeon]
MVNNYFHGSPEGNIKVLEPRAITRRSDQTKPRVYASPEIGIAAVMLISWDDSIASFGRKNNGPWTLEILEKGKFKDTDGWIYTLDHKGVILVEDGELEVYFEESKQMINKIYVPSALKFAIKHGIEVKYK